MLPFPVYFQPGKTGNVVGIAKAVSGRFRFTSDSLRRKPYATELDTLVSLA